MTGELTKAHAKFINSVGTIKKEGDAQFGKHATLEGILGEVNPKLAAVGLFCTQTFSYTDDGRQILNTTLLHESGEKVESSALFPQTAGRNPLHDWGSNTTYMRRFCLLAILGIAPGMPDNDGDHATRPEPVFSKPVATIPEQGAEGETIENPPVEPEFITQYLKDLVAWDKKHPTLLPGLKHAYKQKFPDFSGSFTAHVQEKKHIEFIDQFTHGLA